MELRHLRYFLAVAEELNFTRAAARLHMSQPPLSQQIRQLERELQVSLFVRSPAGVRLTEAGSAFLERARGALAAVEVAASSARRAGRGEAGRLVIGFGGSAAIDVLSEAVSAHRRRYPAIDVVLHELATSAQIEGLLAGRIHVGLLRERTGDDRLRFEVLRREPLVAVLPAGHRLAARPYVAMRDLAAEDFVLAPPGQSSSFTDVVLMACARAGFLPRVVQEACETLTILGVVAAGTGVSLLPASVTRVQVRGVVYRRLRARTAAVQLAAAWQRDTRSSLVEAFMATCRATIAADGADPS